MVDGSVGGWRGKYLFGVVVETAVGGYVLLLLFPFCYQPTVEVYPYLPFSSSISSSSSSSSFFFFSHSASPGELLSLFFIQ